jgi:hydroxyacylglutathione hydrolase
MIVERTEHPNWLSNAYLVADEPGGHGVLIDGNGVAEPLLERIERDNITITHVLCTHGHGDHVVDLDGLAARYSAALAGAGYGMTDGERIATGGLEIEGIATPGHAAEHFAFLVNGTDCFTADLIFRRTVGGTAGPGGSYEALRRSIMERVLNLAPETRLHPGHREPTTVGEEWDGNPFVRLWRGLDQEGHETCRVRGRDATLVLWAADYDGGHKAWVRYADGQDAIVGGSQVER